jgi:hypothetical protein
MSDLFCRHNRFTAECPICSKGTVLDPGRQGGRRPGAATPRKAGARREPPGAVGRAFSGPYSSAGPYEDELGESYKVRLERVPGGVRAAEWANGTLRRRAPVLAGGDLAALVAGLLEHLRPRETERLRAALGAESSQPHDPEAVAASRGRAGDMQDELRLEGLGDGRIRIARWMLRPGGGWEMQDAPVMLPPERYAEALKQAVKAGLLESASSDQVDSARLRMNDDPPRHP